MFRLPGLKLSHLETGHLLFESQDYHLSLDQSVQRIVISEHGLLRNDHQLDRLCTTRMALQKFSD